MSLGCLLYPTRRHSNASKTAFDQGAKEERRTYPHSSWAAIYDRLPRLHRDIYPCAKARRIILLPEKFVFLNPNPQKAIQL
jgi:hypothetical protein